MDPAKMKVVDLRSELGALGLDTKGNKPALVERLKKALEAKSGKSLPDSSILDTSTEEAEDTPRRPGPAARTRRRSSSTRLASTPAKVTRKQSPPPIEEEKKDISEQYSPGQESESADAKDQSPELSPSRVEELLKEDKDETTAKVSEESPSVQEKDDSGDSPEAAGDKSEDGDSKMEEEKGTDNDGKPEKMDQDGDDSQGGEKTEKESKEDNKKHENRELSEEEEWRQLNERLKIKEQERQEREKKQKEEDAKKLEELSNDPVKLNRLKRKQEKKNRWSNFYRSVEVTNEVLAPPVEEDFLKKGKKESTDTKLQEPEIDDSKITLSWYDSDLNQYLEVPGLNSVVPLSEGAFSHCWAGTRATHGVLQGRVCYEVRVGDVLTTTEATEKEPITSGLRIGWSTTDSTLHLGDGEVSWGYESTGRAVNNSEFKDYGKPLNEKDVVGAYLDLQSSPCKISYTLNGVELGVAFEFDKSVLDGKALFPHILTKNMCYKVNFGYDKYNMLTKTKIVRNRIEIPVEKVLEEKRAREAELLRQKQEAQRKEKERREKEKREREERMRKKREEREKEEREKKEKKDAEKAASEKDGDKETDKPDEKQDTVGEKEKTDDKPKEPVENGEKIDDEKPKAVEESKQEPMETDQPSSDNNKENKNAEGEPSEVTEEQVLKGHVLDKRIKFVIRYTVDEELEGSEACLLPGYVFIAHGKLVPGPAMPKSLAECEVILMVGLPGVGKTHWALAHAAANKDKRYNLLSTASLLDNMKVDCKPFRASYEGRWDAIVTKCAKCVLKLLELARGRRRNYILDQTNVYPSAQRRKLREFEGYRRVACVLVTDEDTLRDRQQRADAAKTVPDPALVDMRANFALPERGALLDDVLYPELGEDAARTALDEMRRLARQQGGARERREEDAPEPKRAREERRPDRSRDREQNRDRWGGGGGGGGGAGGGSRWGPAARGGMGGGGGGGSRWGSRERSGPPPPARFDRWGAPPPPQRNDFPRERESFRGGRGGGGRGGRAPPPVEPPRFRAQDRDKRTAPPPSAAPPHQGSWQRGAPPAPRAPPRPAPGGAAGGNQKDVSTPAQSAPTQGQQGQQGNWNQWTGGWGGWGNWNQNQAQQWNNWNNWNNWGGGGGNQGGAGGKGSGASGGGGGGGSGAGGAGGGQWPANYTAQQWYQWQQWQQQQQNWAGYQQQQGGQQAAATPDAQQQAWAQYYQTYGNAANNASNNAITGGEKK